MTFFIERVEVVGSGLPPATLELGDGLTVVAGASDTGKSYVASLIDYAFGASSSPREIVAAVGYTGVAVVVRDRSTRELFRIERQFGSARALLSDLSPDGDTSNSRSVPARHAAGSDTLSSFLLTRSGFDVRWRIRTNARGDRRSISFRDIAFLSVVHEARIIAERPPFLSENPVEHTPRTDVLRLMVTGDPILVEQQPVAVVSTRDPGGQLELLRLLIAETERELGDADRSPDTLEARRGNADRLRASALATYESASADLLELETRRSQLLSGIRELDGKLAIAEGLEARFNLLAEHYQSDIARLAAMAEAADHLAALPFDTCPVCGSEPRNHRPDLVTEHFRLDDTRSAAEAEIDKTRQLQSELTDVLQEISVDRLHGTRARGDLHEAMRGVDKEVTERITPLMRSSAEQLQAADVERDAVTRVELLLDRLASLRARADLIEPGSPTVLPDPSRPTSGSTAPRPLSVDLRPLLDHVGALLIAWNMPGGGDISFSDRSRDLVIAGEDRESHGKGVRALTCAAFILGLLRNSLANARPHPGIVVLDSPLVAYREPDPTADASGGLIAAGVKEAFYTSLASGIVGGQVIIFENESPSPELTASMRYVHFSKSDTGRYGFFPLRQAT